jgi:hypothetical protein
MFNGRRQPSHGGTSRMMREYQVKAANLIDHCGPLADQARPDPVQRLQIQLLVSLGWNKACCRPLHGLGHRKSISEIIFLRLPKRFCIRGRNLLHIVAQCGQLATRLQSHQGDEHHGYPATDGRDQRITKARKKSSSNRHVAQFQPLAESVLKRPRPQANIEGRPYCGAAKAPSSSPSRKYAQTCPDAVLRPVIASRHEVARREARHPRARCCSPWAAALSRFLRCVSRS